MEDYGRCARINPAPQSGSPSHHPAEDRGLLILTATAELLIDLLNEPLERLGVAEQHPDLAWWWCPHSQRFSRSGPARESPMHAIPLRTELLPAACANPLVESGSGSSLLSKDVMSSTAEDWDERCLSNYRDVKHCLLSGKDGHRVNRNIKISGA
jgi:hypothetical protein